MRICIPPVEREEGGDGTFRQQWREWLTAQDIHWTEDVDATYDVLFVNSWQTPYRLVHRHKTRLPQVCVVHRVDGAGKAYGRTDGADAMQQAVGTLADLTIFQSDYCRRSTVQDYNIISVDGPTIYNPFDTAHFTPDGPHLDALPPKGDKLRVMSVIWSTNRRKGGWRIPMLSSMNPEVEFIYIGRNPMPDNLPNVHVMGALPRDELARALRSADVFLNLSENDPSPNIVLEAMASGLPVLYVPSGGTPELVGQDCGLPIESDAAFRPQLERVTAKLAAYQTAARQRTEQHFAKDIIFGQYWQAVQSAQRRRLPPLWRHWFSHGQRVRLWVWDKIVNYRDWMPARQ